MIGAATLLIVNHGLVRYLYGHQALERLVEGDPDVLIDAGVIQMKALERELITVAALEAAAHKEGFASLDEIDRAILEPGGGICFIGKKPSAESARHDELRDRLDQIQAQLAHLTQLSQVRS
jgi:uncharacterized membrane protein YcaP (DUF421 family)